MNGLLYKDIWQNRAIIALSVLAPTAIMALYVFMFSMADGATDGALSVDELLGSGVILRIGFVLFGYFFGGILQEMIITCDETKKWAYFSATTPTGTDGLLYTKYVVIFMMCGLTYIITTLADMIFCSAIAFSCPDKEDQVISISTILLFVFFFQLIFRALSIPALARFSSAKASFVRMLILLGICFIGGIYLLFGKLPENATDIFETIYNFVESISTGGTSAVSDTLTLIIGVFPFVAIILYCLSYKLSCKLYMKGVETYAK